MVSYLGFWQKARGKYLKGGSVETKRAERVTTDAQPALPGSEGWVTL